MEDQREPEELIDMLSFDSPECVGILVSGDLSHTHRADGPYGYSNASAAFDHAVRDVWAQQPCSPTGEQALLHEARNLQPEAMSCGFTGLVMLHGVLCGGDGSNPPIETRGDGTQRENLRSQWISNVVVNRNATYYGMMAATFQRIDSL